MKPRRCRTAVMLWALSVGGLVYAGSMETARAEASVSDAPAWTELRAQTSGAGAQVSSPSDQQSDLFRQAPTLTGRLRVSEQTLIPYVGAGFGGGYVTERDRALGPQPSLPQQHLFGESMGKSMMPNEFQMGIRIPF